ncbi:hypothetical protein K461DRAFT_308391 [Myriangium duriaei CBS 260.36]|uniref:Uncharacterized protein n=1 Tax=Myriangium duriaei CBS 260.36 TaxID=1168546 RepID=A0A9P4J145_9PEZI|nr:hypothetical protein K461DRAFT_308391 [Myriangium duriaei CBS 260.36]
MLRLAFTIFSCLMVAATTFASNFTIMAKLSKESGMVFVPEYEIPRIFKHTHHWTDGSFGAAIAMKKHNLLLVNSGKTEHNVTYMVDILKKNGVKVDKVKTKIPIPKDALKMDRIIDKKLTPDNSKSCNTEPKDTKHKDNKPKITKPKDTKPKDIKPKEHKLNEPLPKRFVA